MFRMLFPRRTEIGEGCQSVCASADLHTKPSENVPTKSHPKVSGPPTLTADLPGALGWVLASVSVLVGFVIVALATIMDGEEADHRRGDSVISQQRERFRSPNDSILRHPPTPLGDGVIHTHQSHNTTSIPQQSALSEEKHPLDGKEVGKARPVEVQTATPSRHQSPASRLAY
jgi:hypothetical protein